MRRYELMLVLRPDLPDDRVQGLIDRTTRSITASGGQIIKVSPWGRRRLAYGIGQYREGSYYIVVFDAPPATVAELERALDITEEVMRHLTTRIERPASARRAATAVAADGEMEPETDGDLPALPAEDDEEPRAELIDESESEAAPAAIEA